jgi:hypothetical protein
MAVNFARLPVAVEGERGSAIQWAREGRW